MGFFWFVFKRSFQNSLEFYINKNFTSTTGSAASLDKIQMLVFGFVFQQHMERRRKERKGKHRWGGEGRGGGQRWGQVLSHKAGPLR